MSKCILIAEDSKTIRTLIRAFIENRAGFEVCGEAVDGVDAIEKAKELKPDLIILDLAMPRMNGAAATVLKRMMPDALLDLRNRSLPRGTEPNLPVEPLVVNRAARHWNIYLPLGSAEGTYDIRIVTDSGGQLLTATGESTLMSGIALLPVDVNLGSKNLGRCNLEIRKNTGQWNSFPLVLR